jgi:hypothetical protein
MAAKDRREVFREAYRFLNEQDSVGVTFTDEELRVATDRGPSSVTTYLGKWLGEVVERRPNGNLRVLPRFRRYTEERFLDLATQKRRPRANYRRYHCGEVVDYEFLLPLTREDELRRTLDALFYADTVEYRLREVGLDQVEAYIARNPGEADEAYIARVCRMVSDRFGGYSIRHVSGRFRAADITRRAEAAQMLAADGRYLIDETTASVRSIVPVEASKADSHEVAADWAARALTPEVIEEVAVTRKLFFHLFVEAIVELVSGEDAIWLVEDALGKRTLYVFEKV